MYRLVTRRSCLTLERLTPQDYDKGRCVIWISHAIGNVMEVLNKRVNGGLKQRMEKCNEAWLHGLLECMVCSWTCHAQCVICTISGTGRHSGVLLWPKWNNLPDELCSPLLELIALLFRKVNAFRIFSHAGLETTFFTLQWSNTWTWWWAITINKNAGNFKQNFNFK